MEDFKKFSLLKEQPTTASGGTEQDAAHSFECAGCGAEINEGEFKTFGVCDACWDEGVTKKYWGPKKEHIYTDKEIIALAEEELTRLRSELQQAKQEKESMKRIVEELLRAIKFGEAELRITYERYTNYKGSSSLWLMQEILVKYKK